jgi:hypothetical protein
MPDEHLVAAGLLRGVVLTDLHILHDLPFDCPAQGPLLAGNVLLEFLIGLEQVLFLGLDGLILLDLLPDLLNVRRVVLPELLNDSFQLIDFAFQLLDVLLPVDGFLDLDVVVFRGSGK